MRILKANLLKNGCVSPKKKKWTESKLKMAYSLPSLKQRNRDTGKTLQIVAFQKRKPESKVFLPEANSVRECHSQNGRLCHTTGSVALAQGFGLKLVGAKTFFRWNR